MQAVPSGGLGRRVVLGCVAVAALITVPATVVLANKPANTSGAQSCTLTTTGLGAPLTLSGSGYSPGTMYGIVFNSPAGVSGTSVTADSAGSITLSTYAAWPGTYTVNVTSMKGKGSVITTCSLTV